MKYIITILLALTLCSCGARKVNKQHSEVSSVVKDTTSSQTNSKTTEVVNSDITVKDNTSIDWNTETATVTPIDAKEPVVITDTNGKTTTIKNATVVINKASGAIKNDVTTVDKGSVSKTDTTAVKANSGHVETKTSITDSKVVDKKEATTWVWWLLLLIPAGYLVYKGYKKFSV